MLGFCYFLLFKWNVSFFFFLNWHALKCDQARLSISNPFRLGSDARQTIWAHGAREWLKMKKKNEKNRSCDWSCTVSSLGLCVCVTAVIGFETEMFPIGALVVGILFLTYFFSFSLACLWRDLLSVCCCCCCCRCCCCCYFCSVVSRAYKAMFDARQLAVGWFPRPPPALPPLKRYLLRVTWNETKWNVLINIWRLL